jgi:hypothetical protein
MKTNCIERFTDIGKLYRKKHIADLRVNERGCHKNSILLRFDSDTGHVYEVRLTREQLAIAIDFLDSV